MSATASSIARARFKAPTGLAAASDGTLVVADTGNHTIRRIVSGLVSTLAGTAGNAGSTDDTGAAARFNAPQGVAIDSAGNVFVADTGNNAVRKISPAGVVTTVATGFSAPKGIAVDAAGTLYVADTGNHVIKTVASGGNVSVLAGTVGAQRQQRRRRRRGAFLGPHRHGLAARWLACGDRYRQPYPAPGDGGRRCQHTGRDGPVGRPDRRHRRRGAIQRARGGRGRRQRRAVRRRHGQRRPSPRARRGRERARHHAASHCFGRGQRARLADVDVCGYRQPRADDSVDVDPGYRLPARPRSPPGAIPVR